MGGESYPGRSSRRDSSVDRHADKSSDTGVDNVKSRRRAAAAISDTAAPPPADPVAVAATPPPPVTGEPAGGAVTSDREPGDPGCGRAARRANAWPASGAAGTTTTSRPTAGMTPHTGTNPSGAPESTGTPRTGDAPPAELVAAEAPEGASARVPGSPKGRPDGVKNPAPRGSDVGGITPNPGNPARLNGHCGWPGIPSTGGGTGEVGTGGWNIAARPASDESTLGGKDATGAGSAAIGVGPLAPDSGGAGSDTDTPGRFGTDTATPVTDTETLGSDIGTLGTDTVGLAAGAAWALEPVVAGWDATAWRVGSVAGDPADADCDDAAGDADAGTGAAAVAGTVTAAAPAPDAGVAGGSLRVGGAGATRGVAGTGTLGADAGGDADTAAAPVTDGDSAAALGAAATAAPAPDAFTAAAAPSMALWAVDRPTCATEPGDTAAPACATWSRAKASRAITIPITFGAPGSSRPRLAIV